jgi:hypothetical protein
VTGGEVGESVHQPDAGADGEVGEVARRTCRALHVCAGEPGVDQLGEHVRDAYRVVGRRADSLLQQGYGVGGTAFGQA